MVGEIGVGRIFFFVVVDVVVAQYLHSLVVC